MSVRELGKAFASELHRAALKERGFRKSGNTFSIERNDYVEMLQIQGSSWNSGEEPWVFYINLAVCFKGIANSASARGIKYDADARIRSIVPDAPHQFELTAVELANMVASVAALSEEASRRLPPLLEPARARAARGLYTPLPLPDTWSEKGW